MVVISFNIIHLGQSIIARSDDDTFVGRNGLHSLCLKFLHILILIIIIVKRLKSFLLGRIEQLEAAVNDAVIKEKTSEDKVQSFGDVKVVVDPASAQLLSGASLDYADGLNESGFKITNPNANRTCGCGQSFS